MAEAPPDTSFLATTRGKAVLVLLASIAFLDFVDASIVNVALPDIRSDLDFSVQNLQWVMSGYLLTYGGFMLLGGRLGDLLGRRRVLVAGTSVFAAASLVGGLAGDPGVLVAARLVQGLGAALMLPAALSFVTTLFRTRRDRATALGVWGGMAGLASAAGVFLGGLLTEGPGWRWVLFVNPPIALVLLVAVFRLLPAGERVPTRLRSFDLGGTVLVTGGMLLLVHALVEAPDEGWSSTRTIGELALAGIALVAFLLNEHRHRNPLVSLSVFRIRGLGAADVAMLIAAAGIIAMFYFLTLYMQTVLGYSPIETGSAYLPFTAGVAVAAGVASQLMTRIGTKPLIVAGALIGAAGLYLLSRMSVDGTYLGDLLPGLLVTAVGLGVLFVAIATAANAGVPKESAGLAAALLNSAQQVGGALGLAIFTAVAASRADHLLAGGAAPAAAVTGGFQRALLVEAVFVLAVAVIALRTTNSRGEDDAVAPAPQERTLAPATGG